MLKGTLYDIEEYNDFEDSLAIMETIPDNSFNLIFMELPRLLKSTKFIYELSEHKYKKNIHSTFLCKCIENAYRLLTDKGILVVFAPKTTYSNQDYTLLLNQFFHSITELIHICGIGQLSLLNTIFFCSKQKNYCFPKFTKLRSQELYPYEDELGLYRLSYLFLSKYNPPYRDYTWKGITPPTNKHWCYEQEKMNKLYDMQRIVIENANVYQKIYRSEEPIAETLLLKRSLGSLGNFYVCDPQSISRIFSAYCKPGDSVFCPFDYDGWFTTMAREHELLWTSIKLHIYSKMSGCFPSTYDTDVVITQLPTGRKMIKYQDDVVVNADDLNELKAQIIDLTTPLLDPQIYGNIKSIHDIPRINTKATGANLKRLRIAKNLSAGDVVTAFRGEITRQTLNNWELGKYLPKNIQRFAKLAALYGVSSLEDVIILFPPNEDK